MGINIQRSIKCPQGFFVLARGDKDIAEIGPGFRRVVFYGNGLAGELLGFNKFLQPEFYGREVV